MTADASTPSNPKPRRAAYFDVDGTLTKTTIVGPLVYFRKNMMPLGLRELWLASLLPRALYWLVLDKLSRTASNRSIYGCYANLDADQAQALVSDCHAAYWKPRIFPQGRERLKQLGSEGLALVLVTGSLDFLIRPFADEMGAELFAPRPEIRHGVFTGRLSDPPMTGEEKVKAVRSHAQRNGIVLQESYSFGDAIGDLPMLECVGHPVAVNPGRRLQAVAKERNWPVERWTL